MIELQDITKTYGSGEVTTRVLTGVSFTIERGEYVALMGTSGTGKSTLMNIIGLLDQINCRRDGICFVTRGSECDRLPLRSWPSCVQKCLDS